MLGFALWLAASVAYLVIGNKYAKLQKFVYRRIHSKKEANQKIHFWEKSLAQFFWPIDYCGCSPYIKFGRTPSLLWEGSEMMTEDGRKVNNIITDWVFHLGKTSGYNFMRIIFWPFLLFVTSLPNIIVLPLLVNRYFCEKIKTKKALAIKITREQAEVNALLPAARLNYELEKRKSMVIVYRDNLSNPDAVYNQLIREINNLYNSVDEIVREYQEFTGKIIEHPTEANIYAIALDNRQKLGLYRDQVEQKKNTLSDFLNEIINRINQESKSLEKDQRQEASNAKAISVLSGLDQKAKEINLRTQVYFHDKFLNILNLLDSLMDDTRSNDLVRDALTQIRSENQPAGLSVLNLSNSENFQDFQTYSLTCLELIDDKIEEIKLKLDIPTDESKKLLAKIG